MSFAVKMMVRFAEYQHRCLRFFSRIVSQDTMVFFFATVTGKWKVSNKIQQLLNTLKRPKRRPLPEFYIDDETDLEIAANPKDPNAPKPEGHTMTPAAGEQLVVSEGIIPRRGPTHWLHAFVPNVGI